MARLPNAEHAVVDVRKLSDYCLSPTHPRGRHKARVFARTLGLTARNADWLRQALLHGVQHSEATLVEPGRYGDQWRADIPIERQDRRAVVRTVWLVGADGIARFVTCWVA